MAYSFDGTAMRLTVDDTAALDITGSLTLFVWCTRGSAFTTNNRGLLVKWMGTPTNDRSYQIAVNGSSTHYPSFLLNKLGTSAAIYETVPASETVGLNVWSSLGGTYSPSVSSIVYLNGTAVATRTDSVPSELYNSAAPLLIGQQYDPALETTSWIGNIAEAAVWNVALTADEMVSLHKGFKPNRVRPQSLVFYAPLTRNLIDRRGGLPITNERAVVANHPRVY